MNHIGNTLELPEQTTQLNYCVYIIKKITLLAMAMHTRSGAFELMIMPVCSSI